MDLQNACGGSQEAGELDLKERGCSLEGAHRHLVERHHTSAAADPFVGDKCTAKPFTGNRWMFEMTSLAATLSSIE